MSHNINVEIDYSRMMSDAVGNEHGISDAEMAQIASRKPSIDKWLSEFRGAGKADNPTTFFDLPDKTEEAKLISDRIGELRDKFDTFVVLGIGGSALGNTCLRTALCHPFHNRLEAPERKGMRVEVLDNVDPDLMAGAFDIFDPERTVFNVITKSGSTAETMSQLLFATSWLKERLGDRWKSHIIATTDEKKGSLRRIADIEGIETFIVPGGVGGRFSVLSPVGLISSAAAGIDIVELLEGSAAMKSACEESSLEKNPGALLASLYYLAGENHGKHIAVMMPYSQRLRDFADWFRQLWAESTGKRWNLSRSKEVYAGQTPVKALGVTDQHSQVQLYIEGPNNKTITLFSVEDYESSVTIPAEHEYIDDLSYLHGRLFSDLFAAERIGTEYALTAANRPNLTISIPKVNPRTVGELIFLYEYVTAYACLLYDVDPFDQPGVELGKDVTYAQMGKKGYDKLLATFNESRNKIRARKFRDA
ncbi:MAG: glucose-6-phosphate isomerase [Planctomycetes bacterium]|nr:glucose-6-phosphate isomerase [Planctomycetota bacterium]MCR4318226.1 glucose-6-phosphate isomerase [Planctomycetota bacterium]